MLKLKRRPWHLNRGGGGGGGGGKFANTYV